MTTRTSVPMALPPRPTPEQTAVVVNEFLRRFADPGAVTSAPYSMTRVSIAAQLAELLTIANDVELSRQKRVWEIAADTTVVVQSVFGTVNTITEYLPVGNADSAFGPAVAYATGAVANTNCGLASATTVVRADWDVDTVFRVGYTAAGDFTDCRTQFGLVSADPSGSSDPAISAALFRYATDVDGTAFWRCYTKDGATAQVTTTTNAIAAGGNVFRIRTSQSLANVRFYIDNALVATHATNIPAASTMMGVWCTNRNLAAANKNWAISRIKVCHE